MVYAARDDAAATFEAPGVAELVLTGLGPDAARSLLGVHVEGVPVEDVAPAALLKARVEVPAGVSQEVTS